MTKMLYQLEKTGEQFVSYMKAVTAANAISSNIIEIETGRVRWTPAPSISPKKIRMYNERLAAYEASKRMQQK